VTTILVIAACFFFAFVGAIGMLWLIDKYGWRVAVMSWVALLILLLAAIAYRAGWIG
jgi:hypothetical protein